MKDRRESILAAIESRNLKDLSSLLTEEWEDKNTCKACNSGVMRPVGIVHVDRAPDGAAFYRTRWECDFCGNSEQREGEG